MNITIEAVNHVIAQGVDRAWLVHCPERRRALLIGEWAEDVARFMPDKFAVIYVAIDSGLTEWQTQAALDFVRARALNELELDGVELEV